MTLNENADIDTSQVTDARGSGGGGFGSGGGMGGIPIPVGGGLLGTLLVLGLVVAGMFLGPKLYGDGDNGAINETCSTANPESAPLRRSPRSNIPTASRFVPRERCVRFPPTRRVS